MHPAHRFRAAKVRDRAGDPQHPRIPARRQAHRFGGAGEPRVLVLSSQHHASGINLQCARNLVLLHPYCTPSATYPEAVRYHDLAAFERQAIGRVRRYPQQQLVRVWKLVCAGTVEQALGRGLY